jgi:KTSC domain
MQFTPLKSSNLEGVHYDPLSKNLTVKFLSGQTHAYEAVTPEIHAGLMKADSPGKYFHAHIRNAHPSSRVDEQ